MHLVTLTPLLAFGSVPDLPAYPLYRATKVCQPAQKVLQKQISRDLQKLGLVHFVIYRS